MDAADLVSFTVRTISGLVHDAMVLTDTNLVVLHTNEAFRRLTGSVTSALVGLPLSTAAAEPLAFGRVLIQTPPAIEDPDGEPGATDVDLVHASGERRSVRARAAKLGNLVVFTFSRRSGTPDTADDDHRLAELETAMRNISWEVQALGYGQRFGHGSTAPITADGLRNLSKREREVLDAFLQGLSVSSSATSLHVSEHTVRSHLKAIYRKLGVRSQAELMLRMRGN